MYDNKSFQVALIVSVIVHSLFFLSLPHISVSPSKPRIANLKVKYLKIKEPRKKKKSARKKSKPIVSKLPEIKKEEIRTPPKVAKKKAKKAKKVKVEKKHKEAVALKNVKEKKFEKVIAEETNSAKKATYISYYRAVREKIRKHADRNYPRNRNLGQGEILLNFLVTAKGNLLNMQIVDKESTKDALLRNIALDSVEDAGPFPPFPKGMNQYQINFNIIISFEDR